MSIKHMPVSRPSSAARMPLLSMRHPPSVLSPRGHVMCDLGFASVDRPVASLGVASCLYYLHPRTALCRRAQFLH
jgi:hypothetical protein